MTETLIPAAPEVVTPETVTPERVTPLRPSEALRLGRLTRPVRIEGQPLGGDTAACALGAIATGVGIVDIDANYQCFSDRWPEYEPGIVNQTWMLYDAGASDDQIVAFLESLGL